MRHIPGTKHLDTTPLPGAGLRLYCHKHGRCVRPVELHWEGGMHFVCRECLEEEWGEIAEAGGEAPSHGRFGFWMDDWGTAQSWTCHFCNRRSLLYCSKCGKAVCMEHSALNGLCVKCKPDEETKVAEAHPAEGKKCHVKDCKSTETEACFHCTHNFCSRHVGVYHRDYVICEFCVGGATYCA